jgi:hypothetical protein
MRDRCQDPAPRHPPSRQKDGSWQLLAAIQGGHKSVEFFERIRRGKRWSPAWRGYVLASAYGHL